VAGRLVDFQCARQTVVRTLTLTLTLTLSGSTNVHGRLLSERRVGPRGDHAGFK
jgi:hypothetical protein